MISTPPKKPFASLDLTAEVATKMEEKTKKKKRSPNSSEAPAEIKKRKRIVLRVRKSTKRTSGARVLDFEALHRLKDFLEDDEDMELSLMS